MADLIQSINDIVNGFVWGVPMMILIVGTGVYFTIRTDFLQIRKFGYAMKNTVGKCFQKTKAKPGCRTPLPPRR